MDRRYRITAAAPHHVETIPKIELAAAVLLRGHAPEAVLAESTPVAAVRAASEAGTLWVALAEDVPVGFALVRLLTADLPHLEELDVLPEHGRRGIGTALVRTVVAWAHRSRYRQVTLTTFRDVPWNMPFYSRLGFEEVDAGPLEPELAAIVQDEHDRGLDRTRRVIMRYLLHRLDGAAA